MSRLEKQPAVSCGRSTKILPEQSACSPNGAGWPSWQAHLLRCRGSVARSARDVPTRVKHPCPRSVMPPALSKRLPSLGNSLRLLGKRTLHHAPGVSDPQERCGPSARSSWRGLRSRCAERATREHDRRAWNPSSCVRPRIGLRALRRQAAVSISSLRRAMQPQLRKFTQAKEGTPAGRTPGERSLFAGAWIGRVNRGAHPDAAPAAPQRRVATCPGGHLRGPCGPWRW